MLTPCTCTLLLYLNLIVLHNYKNKFTALKRTAEKNYNCNQLEQAKNNLRETWRIIKNVINENKNHVAFPESFKYNDEIISEPRDISNKFNEYFVNIVGPILDSKI